MKKSFAKKNIRKLLLILGSCVFLAWTLLPLIWMFISSISSTSHLLDMSASWFPDEPTWERYKDIMFSETILNKGTIVSSPAAVFKRALFNSIIVSGITTAVSLVVGSMAAYAFARLAFKFRDQLLMLILFFQLLPSISLLIPLYIMFRKMGVIDHLICLVLVYVSFTLTYTIWVMSGYFRSISRDLEAAAMVDGCSRFGAYVRVIIPVAKPGLTAVGILAFLMAWDEFMYSLIFMNSQSNKTITVALSEFTSKFGIDYGMMMAAGCIATVIPVFISIAFQKNITQGLTMGAIKE
ncbi:carbohydrate ABC transporter permease [Mordavella massiliensis]|uniref:Carbohydrate ABC transporter permease n=1 Tax=Mordavella massiliensis TaxID=1871024 RepID=A0A939BFH0_9CLOT|nr:carbohydrate ABC transporter permease [Mordavella massiliensis]MBM6947065.1 carbohydrate ABC transporter permease [Mordavella massiliensis]